MKKILILCDAFPPAFGPRMGYLCKYLLKEGWEPVVVTEALPEEMLSYLIPACPVVAVPYYSSKGGVGAKLQRGIFFLLDKCFGYKNTLLYRAAKKIVKQQGIELILCSTYRDFPLQVASKLARLQHLPWVADLRDIIEQYAGLEYIARPLPWGLTPLVAPAFKRQSIAKRNRALREAQAVTTVSPWHVEVLKPFNSNTHLIYNGYDPELFFPARHLSSQFVITYTGRIISRAMRDPSLLLEAIEQLSQEGLFTPNECRVRCYTDAASRVILAAQAEEIGVTAYMDFREYVAATEVPRVLNESSVLLLLANKAAEGGPKGMMTTKVFEYLAIEKPVLCVRSDESYLAALLAETGAGLAAVTVEEVVNFLKLYYAQWKEQGYTAVRSNQALIQTFSRAGQAQQFREVFVGKGVSRYAPTLTQDA
jgi:glycosyltransferase involved in cell wall biosynthesis